jgi:hypothetical protein
VSSLKRKRNQRQKDALVNNTCAAIEQHLIRLGAGESCSRAWHDFNPSEPGCAIEGFSTGEFLPGKQRRTTAARNDKRRQISYAKDSGAR